MGGVELEHLWSDPDRRDAGLLRLAARTIGHRSYRNRSGIGCADAYTVPPEDRGLTIRQIQCLTAASVGLGRKETADLLGIGIEGVADHLTLARRNLAAKTTPHAVAEALRQGLID